MRVIETTVSKLRGGMTVKMADGTFARIRGTHITREYRIQDQPAVWIDIDTGSYSIALPTEPAFVLADERGRPIVRTREKRQPEPRRPRRSEPEPRAKAMDLWHKIWRQK